MTLKRPTLATGLALLVWLLAAWPCSAEGTTPEAAGKAYSLDDLYDLALARAEAVKIARENVVIARKDKTRALSVLIPSVTAFGSYTLSDTDQTTDPVLPSESFDLKTGALGWGLRFDQSFTLNGRELIALDISRDQITRSETDLTTVQERYLLEVATAYFQVLRAAKGLEISKASVARLEKHRDYVAARLKLDDVTKTDMYRAESELSDARAALIADQNRHLRSQAALISLVDLPEHFVLKEPDGPGPEQAAAGVEPLLGQGLALRPEIRSAELDRTVAEKSVDLTKGDRWPVLSIEGQYAWSDETNEGTLGGAALDYDKDISGYSLAAKLSFTLFDGGLKRAETAQARARERQARHALDETKKKVVLDIRDAYLNLSTQKGQLSSLADKLTFARENYRSVSEMYRHGLANSVDMMDANTLLVSSERELSDAQYGYQLAVLALKRATGERLAPGGTGKE